MFHANAKLASESVILQMIERLEICFTISVTKAEDIKFATSLFLVLDLLKEFSMKPVISEEVVNQIWMLYQCFCTNLESKNYDSVLECIICQRTPISCVGKLSYRI